MHIRADTFHTEKSERSIKTANRRMICMINATPHMRMPKIMINRLVKGAEKWINAIPTKNGITVNIRT